MTTNTEFIVEVQSKGTEKIGDLKDKVESLTDNVQDLNSETKASAAASAKMAAGLDKVEKKTRLATKGIDKLKSGFSKFGSVQSLVMAVAGAAIVGYAAKIADAASTLNGFSDELGIDAGKLQVFSDVASLAGGSVEGVASAISALNKGINDGISTGSGQYVDIFKELNLKLVDFKNLKPDEQINKLSEALTGYSKAEQDYMVQALKLDGLKKVLEAPKEVADRLSYLEKNGLILKKDEIEGLNEFTDMWTNLMTDVTNFSTIILASVGETLKEIFNLEPSDNNTLLNRKTAESIANFISRLVIIFKMLYDTVILAGTGIGALTDKGVYLGKTVGVYLTLLVEKMKKLGADVATFFTNFALDDVIVSMKSNFDLFIGGVTQKIGGIEVALGKLFKSEGLVQSGLKRVLEATNDVKSAEEALQLLKDKAPEKYKQYDENEKKYLIEKAKLKAELDTVDNVNDQKTLENSKKIKESTDSLKSSFTSLLEVGRKRIEQNKEEEKTTTKKMKNLSEEKRLLDEISKLENLRLQLMKLQGLDIEVNEKQRELALAQVKKDYTDLEKQAEASEITNKIFDYAKFKIQYDKVTTDLDTLKERIELTSPLSSNYTTLQDEIANKTKEQINLEGQLGIKRKEVFEEEFLSKKQLEDANISLQDSLVTGLKDYVKGAESAEDALGNFFASIAEKILDLIAQQIVLNALTAAFGKGAKTGEAGLFTSLAGAAAGASGGGFGALAANMAGSIFHNGGEIEQSNLMQPAGFNFASDEGFIVAKAGESINSDKQQNNSSNGNPMQPFNNIITIEASSLADSIFKTSNMNRNLDSYFKKNGPMLKNYFK